MCTLSQSVIIYCSDTVIIKYRRSEIVGYWLKLYFVLLFCSVKCNDLCLYSCLLRVPTVSLSLSREREQKPFLFLTNWHVSFVGCKQVHQSHSTEFLKMLPHDHDVVLSQEMNSANSAAVLGVHHKRNMGQKVAFWQFLDLEIFRCPNLRIRQTSRHRSKITGNTDVEKWTSGW